MKRYDTYKPSGIEWLGDIPVHWEVKRVKDLFKINPGFKMKNLDKDTQVSFTPMECLRCGQIEKRTIDYATALSYVPFKNNDILMAKVTPCFENGNIAIAVDLEMGIGFGSSEIYVIRSDERYINRKLAFYLFQSNYFRSIGISSMKGTGGLKRVDPITLNTALYPYISLPEQTAIANYLDTKTTAIDRKIELLTAKTDKYKALRRSLINETVCRGLNPNAPLKDSGIEWIGMIPEHWEVKRMKDIFCFAKGKNSSKYSQEYVNDVLNFGIYPVYSGQTENNGVMAEINTFDYDLQEYILLVTTVGAKAMETKLITGKFSLSQNCATITLTKKRNDIKYLYYFISQLFVEERKTIPTIMQPSLRIEDLNKYFVLLPEITEQMRIAIYLEEKTTKIDTILTNISEQITKLTQLRKTLINDVVTGKIKVTED